MFIFLSKLIPLLVYPLGLACILLLISLRTRSRRAQKRLVAAAIGALWLLGNGWVAGGLVRSLEWRYLPQEDYPQVDAIVVLGGGTYPADYPRPSVEINEAGDRVLHGARLFRAGKAPLLVVTGGNLPWTDSAGNPAEDMAALLISIGVPASAILLEGESLNTYENAVFTRRRLEPIGADRILLVTSALHMPRSVILFENQGFTVIPAPTDFSVTLPAGNKPLSQTWPDYFMGFFPSAFALSHSTAALKEYLGIAVYWLRGWY